MASVRKRKYEDGTFKWVVDFKDERGKRRLKTFTLKKTADQFLARVTQQIESGVFVADANTITFDQAAESFLEHCRKRASRQDRMSKSAVYAYERALWRATPEIGALLLTKITNEDVADLTDRLCADGRAGNTTRYTIRAVNMVFKHAIDRGWLRRNPIERGKLILPRGRKIVHIPSKEELVRLLEVSRVRRAGSWKMSQSARVAIIALGIFGGLRRGEIAALKWSDIDFDLGTIRIRRSRSRLDGLKGPKTAAGIREVPIVGPIADALRELPTLPKSGKNLDAFCLVTATGAPVNGEMVYAYWRDVSDAAGLVTDDGTPRYRLHDLRHAAASLLIEQGLSPLHIKAMMGHANVTTTLGTYGHLFPSDQAIKRAADEVARALSATNLQLGGQASENHVH